MSIIKPGIDAGHVIKQAFNAKTLKKLSKEEDTLNLIKHGLYSGKNIKRPPYNPFNAIFYDKEGIARIREFVKDKNPDEILDAMGIDVFKGKDGKKIISRYGWTNKGYNFAKAGIDEEKLIDGVKQIRYNCDLTGSDLKNLGEIEKIGGTLTIPLFTKLEDLSGLKSVRCIRCQAKDAEDLRAILQRLNFHPENDFMIRGVENLNDDTRNAIRACCAQVGY